MKTYFLLLFSFIGSNLLIGQCWEYQNPKPTAHRLLDIDMVNDSVGWAVGEKGTILKTLDGGNNWEVQDNNIHETTYFSCDFFDENFGIVVGGDLNNTSDSFAIISRTFDGGENWEHDFFNDQRFFLEAQFLNKDTGWIRSSHLNVRGGKLLKTINGGEDWFEIFSDQNISFRFYFLTDQIGWLSHDGALLKTTDGGIKWDTVNYLENFNISDIHFSNEYTGVFIGESADFIGDSLWLTIDGGLTWEPQFPLERGGSSIRFINDTIGWINSTPHIYKTIDGGITWIKKKSDFEKSEDAKREFSFTDTRKGKAIA